MALINPYYILLINHVFMLSSVFNALHWLAMVKMDVQVYDAHYNIFQITPPKLSHPFAVH